MAIGKTKRGTGDFSLSTKKRLYALFPARTALELNLKA